jgi:hypothetical protein
MSETNPYWPLPIPDSLGPLVGADDVRDSLKATIDEWSPFYLAVISSRLAEAQRIGGPSQAPNPLQSFGTWVNEPEARSWGTGMPACYLVTCPGTIGEPRIEGSRKVWATWRAQVIVNVFGTDWQLTADLTSWYEKAVRASVLQHGSLGGISDKTRWVGNTYAGKEHEGNRVFGQLVMGFDVLTPDVIDLSRGPATVPDPPIPPPDDPTVETVDVAVDRVPLGSLS